MFLYDTGTQNSFAVIAVSHYAGLEDFKILKSGDKKYYARSIIGKLDKLVKSSAKGAVFFKDLKADDYHLLRRIIVGKPDELANIIESIKANVDFGIYPAMVRQLKKKQVLTTFGKKIQALFDYKQFTTKRNRWDAYTLAAELGINVCAYCNRNFTFTLASGKNKVVRPEFDHFLPKSSYPYLALSFYNLIPSCHICNSNFKLDLPFNLDEYIHPYLASLDSIVRFSVELTGMPGADLIKEKSNFGVAFFYGNLKSFKIVLTSRPHATAAEVVKAKKNIEAFKLLLLYEMHKDMVVEMIQNAILYDSTYIDALFNKFNGTLFNTREDVLRHITKNYHNGIDMPKRAFSKLSKDIHLEFGLQ